MQKKKSRNLTISRLSGGDKRDRTADLLNAIQALSQLSYTPMFCSLSDSFRIIAQWAEMSRGNFYFFDLIEKKGEKIGIGQRRMGIGRVQDGIYVVGIVFDLFGIKLCSLAQIAAQSLNDQAGEYS